MKYFLLVRKFLSELKIFYLEFYLFIINSVYKYEKRRKFNDIYVYQIISDKTKIVIEAWVGFYLLF